MLAFLKNGYYYENMFETFGQSLAKLPGHVVVPNYEIDIENISNNLILKDENKLELINAISLRLAIAFGHYNHLLNAKSDTQSLIEELNRNTNDKIL